MKSTFSRKLFVFSLLLGITFGCTQSALAFFSLRERLEQVSILSNATGQESATILKRAIDKKVTLDTGSKNSRFYLLHVPKNYNRLTGAPLVIAFHGGMGSAQNMKNGYDIQKKADKEGFIVVFANGASRLKSGNFATWNADNCCGFAQSSESDDIAYVKKIVEGVKAEYKVTKTFAMGMSNGAMFSYKIACQIPELFDAIGAVAGTDNTSECSPKESTPIMHIHALNDDHVLYNGGCGPACMSESEPDFVSVPDTIKKWTAINQCSDAPTRVLSGSGVTCDIYRNCASGSPVQLCTTETGGHSWPGNGNRANPRSGDKEPPSQAMNATDALWNFFSNIK